MSQVHDAIAFAALSVQKNEIKKVFKPFMGDLGKSSWFPDRVGEIKKNEPENIRFLFLLRPKTCINVNLKKYPRHIISGVVNRHCPRFTCVDIILKNAVRSLKDNDIKSAVKFCGVYSHLIADIMEPGHVVFDWIIDVFEPVSNTHSNKEIFTNKECLRGTPDIKGYCPKLLGQNIEQAEQQMVAEILKGSKFGAATAIPIERELYANNIDKAREYSARVQSEAAKKFADFICTVFYLAKQNNTHSVSDLDLCSLPFIESDISCFCRFRPLVDIFLHPSHFDNSMFANYFLHPQPLELLTEKGNKAEQVHGLCVMPSGIHNKAIVKYLLVPGAYNKFSAKVGLNPAFKEALSFLPAVFTVLGDGNELVRSQAIKSGDAPVSLETELGKTRILTLSMEYSGDFSTEEHAKFSRSTSAAHGVWAEPILSLQ